MEKNGEIGRRNKKGEIEKAELKKRNWKGEIEKTKLKDEIEKAKFKGETVCILKEVMKRKISRGNKAAEHEDSNWGMQIDWWLQPRAVFGHTFIGIIFWHMPHKWSQFNCMTLSRNDIVSVTFTEVRVVWHEIVNLHLKAWIQVTGNYEV